MDNSSNSTDTSPKTVNEDISLSPEVPSTPPQTTPSTINDSPYKAPVTSAPVAAETSVNTPQAAETPISTSQVTETPVSTSPAAPSYTGTPAVISSDTTPISSTPDGGKSHLFITLAVAGICVLLLAATAFGSYTMGKHSVKTAMTPMVADTSLKIPAGATIIEQCEPGLGTQYILPKDIPDGPVYNVNQGKVIGVEYMTPLSQMSKQDIMLQNLSLSGQKYDHINIMTMDAHAGMPERHFQVDVMMVPDSVAKKITCGTKSTSPSSMPNMSGSTSKTPSSSSTTMSHNASM